jgi:AraC-like DNA-binding protein
MYSLKEFWQLRNLPVPEGGWDGNVICIETNVEWTFGTNETHGFLSCYTFTIVTCGWVTILYNNRELTLHEGDLYTYSPGFEVTVLYSSNDYRGICLLGDEHFTLSQPSVRDAIRTVYFSVMQLGQPCLHLNSDDSRHLQELMQLAIYYLQSNYPRRFESLRLLYSLFLTDLTAMQEHSIERHRFSNRQEELFLGFQRLVTQHFAEHHDIGFYADRLYITTTYLSRIVREVSGGRTVMDFINRLLLMEAVFLLRQTSLSVAQIADRLHFADTTTFARFFTRLKGVSPKEFRKGK